MSELSNTDRRQIGLLLGPSWLSGLVAIVLGLVVSLGVVIAFGVNNSGLQQQLMAWQQTQPAHPVVSSQQNLPENDHPTLRGSWPLLLVWSLTGLVVYGIVTAIIRDIGRAEEIRESLDYVNSRPQTLLATTARHVLLRVMAAVLLVAFGSFFLRQIIPYSLTAAHASASDLVSLDAGLYVLLSFGVVVVSLHIQTILLRLALGKTRLFSGA